MYQIMNPSNVFVSGHDGWVFSYDAQEVATAVARTILDISSVFVCDMHPIVRAIRLSNATQQGSLAWIAKNFGGQCAYHGLGHLGGLGRQVEHLECLLTTRGGQNASSIGVSVAMVSCSPALVRVAWADAQAHMSGQGARNFGGMISQAERQEF